MAARYLVVCFLVGCLSVSEQSSEGTDGGRVDDPLAAVSGHSGHGGGDGVLGLGQFGDEDGGSPDEEMFPDADVDAGPPDAGSSVDKTDAGGLGPCMECSDTNPCRSDLICAQHPADGRMRCWVPCDLEAGGGDACDAIFGAGRYVCWGSNGYCSAWIEGTPLNAFPAGCSAYLAGTL